MSEWQPGRYEPGQRQQRPPAQPAPYGQVQPYQPPAPSFTPAQPQAAPAYSDPPARHLAARAAGLTAAQQFWYVLSCIALGAGYFAKIPAKKAMADFGMTGLTGAEGFWYVLMCIPFGAGYFAKLSTAKALSELAQFRAGYPPNRLSSDATTRACMAGRTCW